MRWSGEERAVRAQGRPYRCSACPTCRRSSIRPRSRSRRSPIRRARGCIEQSFEFDLISTEKLLSRYLDREITVEQPRGQGVGVASPAPSSALSGLILKAADGSVTVVNGYSARDASPSLPGGLISRPTLVWDIDSGKAGAHDARIAYQTGGVTWWSDYNLIYSRARTPATVPLDVGAWVTIINQSGATFEDAKLKLIAGDVHRAQPAPTRPPRRP